jgi:hypothetical protein
MRPGIEDSNILIRERIAVPGARSAPRDAGSQSRAREDINSGARDWPQWGGPTRNFMSDSKGLASSWPAGGPKKIWSRALGEGHSSIVVEDGRLYTLYRNITKSPQGTTHEEAVGSAVGAALAFGMGRLAGAMLIGVDGYDASVIAGAAMLAVIVALLAGALPARRASAVNPIEALRSE